MSTFILLFANTDCSKFSGGKGTDNRTGRKSLEHYRAVLFNDL